MPQGGGTSRDHRNISVYQMCAEGYRKVVEAGTHHRVRLPVTWRMLLDSESSIPAWGIGGKSHVVVLEPQLFYDRPIRRDLCK